MDRQVYAEKNKKDYIFSMGEPVYSDGNGKLYYVNNPDLKKSGLA